MPRRPRSHELESVSRNRLHEIFTQVGWVVWDLQPDYGEDLLVRIFVANIATHFSFFVQAKATDHLERYLHEEGEFIRFPIDIDHIEYWKRFSEPIILTVWDAKSNITYWQSIQEYLEGQNISKRKKKNICIDIPINNILNEEGIEQIANHTRSRYARFERERQGAEVLIRFLEELGVNITQYDPQEGVIQFRNPDGNFESRVFGSQLLEMANGFGLIAEASRMLASDNSILQKLIDIKGDQLTIEEEKEKLLRVTESLNDLFCEIRKKMEKHNAESNNNDLIVLRIFQIPPEE